MVLGDCGGLWVLVYGCVRVLLEMKRTTDTRDDSEGFQERLSKLIQSQ